MLHPETALKIADALDVAEARLNPNRRSRYSTRERIEIAHLLIEELEDRDLKLQPVDG